MYHEISAIDLREHPKNVRHKRRNRIIVSN